MIAQDFLIELGCEELPPKSLLALSTAFADLLGKQLTQYQISYQTIKPFATPRRLALLISNLAEQQPDQNLQKRGPALSAAFNAAGEPTPAALGFAKSCGVNINALGKLETDKGSWLIYDSHLPGKSTVSLLPELITTALQQLPIAKRMRWGTRTESFIRPVKWVLALYGNDVVEMSLFGCRSDRLTYGHRVHAPQAISIQHPQAYADSLNHQGYVIANFETRKNYIIDKLEAHAKSLSAELHPNFILLIEEVTALVEWPVILAGEFENRFLQIPNEALIQTMNDNQKYFALIDENLALKPQFLIVSNLEVINSSEIIKGNEKVIRPRFSDAEFFFKQDQQHPLEHYNELLKLLIFQNKLGSVYDKVLRVQAISEKIAVYFGMDGADIALTKRAAFLCKADLATQMVQEMPELQGIMGGYYAKLYNEDIKVSLGIQEHYLPTQIDSPIPFFDQGKVIALADKLDTIVSIFAVGLIPSGDKDPFALRRAAVGCIRILNETTLINSVRDISLLPLLQQAATSLSTILPTINVNQLSEQVWLFIRGRLENYCNQRHDIDSRIFQAVYALPSNSNIYDLNQRITNLHQNFQSADLQSLSNANKRVNNLLKKLSLDTQPAINTQFFEISAEKNLYQALIDTKSQLDKTLHNQDYSQAIVLLSKLRQPVDEFFEQVHIMADDINLKNNRLALLKLLRNEFLKIADLSYLVIE